MKNKIENEKNEKEHDVSCEFDEKLTEQKEAPQTEEVRNAWQVNAGDLYGEYPVGYYAAKKVFCDFVFAFMVRFSVLRDFTAN